MDVKVDLRVISLGAGVQSSAMLLMALEGAFGDRPDCAIFADTQWEPAAVYRQLEYLMKRAADVDFPVYVVTAGDIREQAALSASGEKRFIAIPSHILNLDGKPGMNRRQCTREFKIAPIQRQIRNLLGLKRGEQARGLLVESWQGISLDEATRMRDSRLPWIKHRYPLIDLRMTRADCKRWLAEHGHPEPPKSACIGCPFHDDRYWRDLKLNRPDEWAQAVEFDHVHRHQYKLDGEAFLHRSLKPLDEVDLSSAEDRGQLNLFENECEGVCGV